MQRAYDADRRWKLDATGSITASADRRWKLDPTGSITASAGPYP